MGETSPDKRSVEFQHSLRVGLSREFERVGAVDGCGCEAAGPSPRWPMAVARVPGRVGSVADTSSTDAEFSSVRVEGSENFSDCESHCKMLARQRTREFQPCPFCFRIFLPATRSRIARRNFSRSAGLSMSSLRFIASATVLA